jgi:hypothetical protein
MPFVSLSEKERGIDMATIDPKKGHHIFNNALLSLLEDPPSSVPGWDYQ